MNLINSDNKGYQIKNKEGNINLKKFENTLDWSLDTIKLQDEYRKETRRKDFYFVVDRKKYTQVIINIKFTYSYKEFNKAGKNTYIKAGYCFNDCVFEDGVCLINKELIGIQTNIEISNPVSEDILGKYFAYTDGHYEQINTIPVLINKADLRKYLYKYGFVCDGIKYVRYKRSSGSSRVGKCLFVNEIVSKRMDKWDKCGIVIKEGDPIDLAAWEAYIALPMSSIIDTMIIEPESILILDDYDSVFEDTIVSVKEKNGVLVSEKNKCKVTNTIWDGESLLDASMFGKYSDKGMLLLRNRFFKTCAFNTNIQQFFKDNNITEISQLKGFTLAKDVSQIKLITTKSSVKYVKFGTLRQWLKNIDSLFGIVKYEKETHFFDGRMVQCHYQLLNTIELSYENVQELLKPSIDYIGAVRKDPAVLRYHIGYAFKSEEDENQINPYKTKNEIIFKLLGLNDDFARTKIYKDFRDSIVKGFFRNLKRGHLLLNGNYSTLLGNGLELLYACIDKFDGNSILPKNSIHSKRFSYNTDILGSRSPHVTMGNVLIANNAPSTEIDKYFNLTNEIVYINSIGENILQRLSGADMDSDTMLLTDNKILIEAAKKNYDKYSVPTNMVESQKHKRYYDSDNKSDLDIKTSVNKIGEIVNLSQQLNSLYWDNIHKGISFEKNEELYNDICILDVLSGIEIDKAKKEYSVDSGKEIDRLKRKYKIIEDEKTLKPMFFKMITTENGFKLSPNTNYKYFDTPMDYLQKILNSVNYRQARAYKLDLIPFIEIIRKPDTDAKSGYYSILKNNIISTIKDYKDIIGRLYINYEDKDKLGKEFVQAQVAEYKQECIDIIEKMSSHEYLMYIVLKELDKKENRSIKNLMFEVLFGKPNETFMKMINKSKKKIYKLEESLDGCEEYYSYKFKRVSSY